MKTMLAITLLCLSCFPRIAVPQTADDNMARLRAGEILLLEANGESAGGSVHLQFLSRGPAKAIWDVLLSCESAFIFVVGIEACEMREDAGGRLRVHQVVRRGWLIPTQDFVVEFRRDPYRELQFKLAEGNLRELEGRWRFSETPDGVLVDHRIRIAPAVPAPRFLVRWSIRRDMPDLAACVRGLAAGSSSVAQRAEDLARCPGEAPVP
jgi:hypothetical protein